MRKKINNNQKIWFKQFHTLLKEKKITYIDVANFFGVRPETISRWAAGKHSPTSRQIKQLFKKYNVGDLDGFFNTGKFIDLDKSQINEKDKINKENYNNMLNNVVY